MRVKFPPSPALLKMLGSVGYRLGELVAEWVDNAVDAGEKVEVEFVVSPEKIVFIEHGPGIPATEEAAGKVLTLGRTAKRGSWLGGKGCGMKTSLSAAGGKFRLIVAQQEDLQALEVEGRMDEFSNGTEWELPARLIEKPFPNGVMIEVEQLHVLVNPQTERRAREHLSRVFRRYIKEGRLSMTMNGEKIDAHEFDIVPQTRREFELDILGQRVKGWVAEQRNRKSKRPPWGFDLMRCGRVIYPSDRTGLGQHPGIAGVFVGEVNLENVPVSLDKRDFLRDSPEFRAYCDQIAQTMKPLIQERRQVWSAPRPQPAVPQPTRVPSIVGSPFGSGQLNCTDKAIVDALEQILGGVPIRVVAEAIPSRETITTGTEPDGALKVTLNTNYLPASHKGILSVLAAIIGACRELKSMQGAEFDALDVLESVLDKLSQLSKSRRDDHGIAEL